MSILRGEISYKPRNLLLVDGSIIESDDVSAHELRAFILLHESNISNRVTALHIKNVEQARRPELKQKPVIYLARLALHEWDRSVFQSSAVQNLSRVTTSPEILLPGAIEYWNTLEDTNFTPEIHIRGSKALEGTAGIWLTLKS